MPRVIMILLLFLGLIVTGISIPVHQRPTEMLPQDTDNSPVIGYDCNQTEPEILSLSSLEVGPCPPLSDLRPVVETVFGQIIQKHLKESVHVRTCQLTRSTSYFKCGKNWINYNVYPPQIGYIEHLSPKVCSEIHQVGKFSWGEKRTPWTNLEVNKTYQMSINEVGWTDQYGYCEGGSFSIDGVVHDNVVVQSSFTLSIRESWSIVDKETSRINLENSVQCPYSKGACYDSMTGIHIWTPLADKCPENKYVQLYKGPINITRSNEAGVVMLTVKRPPFLFAAELGVKSFVCAISMQLTEFPDVFYVPQLDNQYQGNFDNAPIQDIQFITYLNAKMTFSYHDIMDMAQLYYLKSLERTCEVERDMLKNRIEIIRLNSQAGGLSSLLESGMFAKVNGEVIHLIKCEPTPVHLRTSQNCHEALPVSYKGQDVYLLPNTHILTPYSPEIPCSSITPVTYKIAGRWWSYNGAFQPVLPPSTINPRGIQKMGFTKIRSFSKGGMYAIDQIEAVQKLLTFPNLRDAVTSELAAGITRFYGKQVSMDLTSVMSENDWKTIAHNNMVRWWGYFASIGNAISGIIGFYFIYRLAKGILTCFLDAKELHATFGWSLHLFASLWSRLSIYFLNQARRRDQSMQSETDEEAVSQEDPKQPEAIPMMSLYPSRLMPSAPSCSQHH